ncbi:MAG TPA: ThuA domain-containing protein [Gemmataceae bacterium]|nr:ThuA domain-containing protein [Gemmataceae bacterium]
MSRLKLALAVAAAALATGAVSAEENAREVASKFNIKPDVAEKILKALPDKAPARPKKQHKVLIFSKTNGFRHGSIPVGTAALTLLGEKTGAYTAVHSEDDAMFEPETLKQFDLVIMLNTTGDIFLPKQMPKDPKEREAARDREARLKQSLVDFVKGGKGLAGTHSATDTYHNWGEYNKMMGGTFAGHPWHKMVPVKNLAPDHPLNQMFSADGLNITDEIYQFRDDTARPSDRKMLLALDTDRMAKKDVSAGKRKDGLYPISWISTYGKGRTFYCSLGHRDEIYYNPTVLKHYLAGFQYALGDLDADATPTAKDK